MTALFLAVVLLASPRTAPRAIADPLGEEVSYVIRPRPRGDRTDLEITMELLGDEDGTTRVLLPSDRYGVPKIHEYITKLSSRDAELVVVKGQERARDLVHEPSARIRLEYTLSWDPSAHTGLAYRPSVGPRHFHFFDSQWRIRTTRSGEQGWRASYTEVPEGWAVFTNRGPGSGSYSFEASESEVEMLIAGGDYATERFEIRDRPVAVHVRGAFPDRAALIAECRASVTQVRELFGDFSPPFFTVSISERSGIRAGHAIESAFVLLADPDTPLPKLQVLLTHEMFHDWLPGQAEIVSEPPDDLDWYRFDWFVEGFTEYCARVLLLDSGRLTLDQFVDLINADLRELARNPARLTDLDEISRLAARGQFLNRHERLSYLRGPLLALTWDGVLRESGGPTLPELVRKIVHQGQSSQGRVPAGELFGLFEAHGIDAREGFEAHIVRGEAVPLDADRLAPELVLEPLVVHLYDPGFDVAGSRETGRIEGVTPDGPADRAGVRNGMELVEIETRHRATVPVRVILQEEGQQRTLEYLPRGHEVRTGQYVRRDQ